MCKWLIGPVVCLDLENQQTFVSSEGDFSLPEAAAPDKS